MSGSQPKTGGISPAGYRPRLVDAEMVPLLRAFGGLVIDGAKWCGKTWTGRHFASSAVYVQDRRVRQRADVDPDKLLSGIRPVLVDGWQDVPDLWDVARRLIDDTAAKGQFIFTGSSVPPRDATKHSGTGRFARLRMRPMSLFESGHSNGKVSLSALLNGGSVESAFSGMTYQSIIRLICRGGWPASLAQGDVDAMAVPKHYLAAVAESDLTRLDGVARNPAKIHSVLRSLARNTATPARPSTIHADVIAAEGHRSEVSVTTIRDYLAALERIFVIDDLPAWRPSLRSKTALLISPTRHLVDPSLAVAALEADPERLEADPETTGLLFESLCVRDLRIYAGTFGGSLAHYRDNKGLEADAIVTAPGNRWGAVEVKLGMPGEDQAARQLLRLKAKLAGEVPEPEFLMVLSATSPVAHTRDDGVHVVPIDCLGP